MAYRKSSPRLRAPGPAAQAWILAAAALALSSGAPPLPAAVEEPLPPLVITEAPVGGTQATDPCAPGARLVRVESTGERTVLTPDLAGACDPALDAAAERLYFSGRETAEAPWRVWELELATGTRRALSPEELDCRQPAPLPVGNGGTDRQAAAPPVVFACEGDVYRSPGRGSEGATERLTFSGGVLSAPRVLPDGRLLLRTEPPGEEPRLLTALPDGTWAVPFRDAPFPGLEAARPVAGEALLVAMAPDGATTTTTRLFRLSMADPFAPAAPWGPEPGWELRDPEALPGGTVLAAARPASGSPGESFRVVRLAGSGTPEPVAAPAPGHHALQPVAVVARPAADPLPSIVKPDLNTGYLLLFDAARSDDPALAGLDRSRVAAVRVFPAAEGAESPSAVEVPPAADGSVYLEVPADRALGLALVDREGRVIARTGHGLWVRPNERRACLGCHVSARYAPPNVRPEALRRQAVWIDWGTERRGPRSELEGMP